MVRKITVVLLCHYWSDEMAEMVGKKHFFQELSPWIQETLNGFKNKDDVELHVVAPNYASNTNLNSEKDGIYFHFYHYSPKWISELAAPVIKRVVHHKETYKIAERLANTLTGFKTPAKSAAAIIKQINPDLIHLYGSENPDYAAPAIMSMNEYPILLTTQGYAYMQEPSKMFLEKRFYNYRVKFERIINQSVKYLTSVDNSSIVELKNNEVGFYANCEQVFYVTAITKIPQVNASETEKKYDVVYYARIDYNKGIEDLIEAVYMLKKVGRPIKTFVMGRGNEGYLDQLKLKTKEREIEDLVCFAGFIENHEDVYKYAAQAKIMVLPTHNDGIPNTIREAMFMKLPVVANNVGGIPTFNENRECIHLVEDSNVKSLAEGICKMLDDEVYRNELVENAYREANEVYSPDAVYEQTITAYKAVIYSIKGI